jgi:hypothetical protein
VPASGDSEDDCFNDYTTVFIDHLYTPLGTVLNYSIIRNLHTLRITGANTKFSFARSAFNSRFLV